jgi:hypothetical protein
MCESQAPQKTCCKTGCDDCPFGFNLDPSQPQEMVDPWENTNDYEKYLDTDEWEEDK